MEEKRHRPRQCFSISPKAKEILKHDAIESGQSMSACLERILRKYAGGKPEDKRTETEPNQSLKNE